MRTEQSDSSVLGRIDLLVQEEEQLYGKSQLSEEDGKRLGELKVGSTNAGTCCARGGRCGSSEGIQKQRRHARRILSRTTSNRSFADRKLSESTLP